MASGIRIYARYEIACDGCGARAEPDTDYPTMAAALAARERIGGQGDWLLRYVDYFAELLCPGCAVDGVVEPAVVTLKS